MRLDSPFVVDNGHIQGALNGFCFLHQNIQTQRIIINKRNGGRIYKMAQSDFPGLYFFLIDQISLPVQNNLCEENQRNNKRGKSERINDDKRKMPAKCPTFCTIRWVCCVHG